MDVRDSSSFGLLHHLVLHNRRDSAWGLRVLTLVGWLLRAVGQLFLQNRINFLVLRVLHLLVDLGVVALLHPPVAFLALHSLLAAGILNRLELLVEVPVGALVRVVVGEAIRVSPEILNVVRIDTAGPVVGHRVGAPDSLILPEIKVVIFLQVMDHLHLDLRIGMGEPTELFVLALDGFDGVGLAKLGLVSGRVVHLLNFIMGIMAIIVLAVVLGAQFMGVAIEIGSSPVHAVVVVDAGLALVVLGVRMGLHRVGHSLVLWVSILNLKN